eukprot:1945336-Pleurochrysis_carterae.AAC.3
MPKQTCAPIRTILPSAHVHMVGAPRSPDRIRLDAFPFELPRPPTRARAAPSPRPRAAAPPRARLHEELAAVFDPRRAQVRAVCEELAASSDAFDEGESAPRPACANALALLLEIQQAKCDR